MNLDLKLMNQLGESLPNFICAVVNLDPIVLEKRWTDGESWPYDFVVKVNRGEDLRWVGSRWPLTHALNIQEACQYWNYLDLKSIFLHQNFHPKLNIPFLKNCTPPLGQLDTMVYELYYMISKWYLTCYVTASCILNCQTWLQSTSIITSCNQRNCRIQSQDGHLSSMGAEDSVYYGSFCILHFILGFLAVPCV